MALEDLTMIGPLTYGGKEDCTSGRCRSMPDGTGGWKCIGWHCVYCDEPTSYQGHNCDVAATLLGEARRQLGSTTEEGS
jgi:hypothetical protein